MTKANIFTSHLTKHADHPDSLELMDILISILTAIDPTAMFDLAPERGLSIIFTDGSRATIHGDEI
jgi:hypothetical protein